MRALPPAEVLFDGEPQPAVLPPCDHYAGSEKLIRKSLALQAQLGPVFDITLGCEDGAQVGQEVEHAKMVASFVGGEEDRFGRDDVRIILREAKKAHASSCCRKCAASSMPPRWSPSSRRRAVSSASRTPFPVICSSRRTARSRKRSNWPRCRASNR